MADKLDQLDYYALLKVPRDASADTVKQAFHRFASKYHPDRFAGAGASARKVARAGQVYRRGAEAYRVLMDPAKRKAYDRGLARGQLRYDPKNAGQELDFAPPGEGPLKARTPMARPFAQKAERAYRAGQWAAARLNLKLALQHDPENPQLVAWLEQVESKLSSSASKRP